MGSFPKLSRSICKDRPEHLFEQRVPGADCPMELVDGRFAIERLDDDLLRGADADRQMGEVDRPSVCQWLA